MAAFGYYVDGKRVPSVTTICGQLGWNKDALIGWANRIGLDGKTLEDGRDAAAGVGTITHAMVESFLKGMPEPKLDGVPREMAEQAQRSFASWLEWWNGAERRKVLSEEPLTSRALMYGGTPDLVYESADGFTLSDTKTGSGIYPEALVQVSGYAILAEENGHKIDRLEIGRFDRDTGSRTIKSFAWSRDHAAARAFLKCREMYDLQKLLQKEAR